MNGENLLPLKVGQTFLKCVYTLEKGQQKHNIFLHIPTGRCFKNIFGDKNFFENCVQPSKMTDVQGVGISHMWGQLSERLASTPTHSEEKGIAQGLAQDATDTADMLNGIHEEHQLHLGGTSLVVVFHVFLHNFLQLDDIIQGLNKIGLNTQLPSYAVK